MNIIIEGPDAAGKSLYAKAFEEKGFKYVKCSPGEHATESKLNFEYFKSLLEKDNQVFDRFFISELVFTELYKRDEIITFDEVNRLISNYIDNNIILILYASDINTLTQRLKERGEDNYLNEIDFQNKKFVSYAWIFSAYEHKNIYTIDISKYNNIDDINTFIERIIGE